MRKIVLYVKQTKLNEIYLFMKILTIIDNLSTLVTVRISACMNTLFKEKQILIKVMDIQMYNLEREQPCFNLE